MKTYPLCLWVLLTACAPRAQDTKTGSSVAPALDCAETADALERRGRHLEASFYWEAALRNGGDETRILPRLFVTQVRSGRLRAAKYSMERLVELHPGSRELREMLTLLTVYTPRPDRHTAEVSP